MINEKFQAEVNKILELAKSKGNVINEEDIILRLLKYDASAKDIEEI